jgi:hypothetical protein
MPLFAGDKLGPYETPAFIGAGGIVDVVSFAKSSL